MDRKAIAVLLVALVAATILALRLRAGDGPVRIYAVPGDPSSLLVDATFGRAFVLDPENTTLRLFDSATGDLLRTVPLGPGGTRPVGVVADHTTGRAFVSTDDGKVRMLDPCGGAVLRVTRLRLNGTSTF